MLSCASPGFVKVDVIQRDVNLIIEHSTRERVVLLDSQRSVGVGGKRGRGRCKSMMYYDLLCCESIIWSQSDSMCPYTCDQSRETNTKHARFKSVTQEHQANAQAHTDLG